jgi:hypothetical protein
MSKLKSRAKSCEPQLLFTEPQASWELPQLAAYASEQHATIVTAEKNLAVHYWLLGAALEIARRICPARQWSDQLKEWGIEKTRATRARAIRRTFADAQAVAELTVEEAFRRRKRKIKSLKQRKKRSTSSAVTENMNAWLKEICQQADQFRSDKKTVSIQDAKESLALIQFAIDELQGIQRQIESQCQF